MYLLAVLIASPDAPRSGLQGVWLLVRVEQNGRIIPPSKIHYDHIIFYNNSTYEYTTIMVSNRAPFDSGTYRINTSHNPKEIDFIAKVPGPDVETRPSRYEGTWKLEVRKGIYELEGENLRFSLAKPGEPRPTKFTPELRVEAWRRLRDPRMRADSSHESVP
jgi:uncharacterized protein (TIGR03067 family)